MHLALISTMEELEAIDNYKQRADVCQDQQLKAILIHNREKENESAAMLLKWIRRNEAKFFKELKSILFTKKNIAHSDNQA